PNVPPADVDDAGLHAFEHVGDFDHGAAITLDEFHLVFCLFGDPLGDFGHEEVPQQRDVSVRRRMTSCAIADVPTPANTVNARTFNSIRIVFVMVYPPNRRPALFSLRA